jgi:predicted Zn-dependent protease
MAGLAGLAVLLLWPGTVTAQRAASPVLDAMQRELARSFHSLNSQPTPPYFLSYQITETRSIGVQGAFGALVSSGENRSRLLTLDLRVGSPQFDNTHPAMGQMTDLSALMDLGSRQVQIPVDDDTAAIRAALWYQTDQRYRRAVQQLTRLRTNARLNVQPQDTAADFSPAPAAHYIEPAAALRVDRGTWEERVRRYTAPFARYGDIYEAEATFSADVETRWYTNSEGSVLQTSRPRYQLFISAFTKADDGMELPRYESYLAAAPEDLPSDSVVLATVQRMIADLHALRTAPLVEAYSGPAILSGRASAVFFHEVFGHRIEGQRQKREEESQTFKRSVNQLVLPAGFSVYSDPTLQRVGTTDLAGSYRYDDEGVAARRVTVVDHGVLRNFLMSRTPIEGFPESNGHGRSSPGLFPVGRQSNLIVQVAEPKSRDELRRLLVEEIRRQGKPYGLLFEDIEGGFTFTQRTIPNAFNVLPVMVYRIFPDGREELVRGVDLVGTPLTVFSRVVAADDDVQIFNGICGAESGSIPVSAVSPGVLVSQVEVQKKAKSSALPPILPAPGGADSLRQPAGARREGRP